MIINIGKRKKTKDSTKQQITVELTKHDIPSISSYMTYVDNMGEHIYDDEYTKTKDSYIGVIKINKKYPIEMDVINTYEFVPGHFTYVDKHNCVRTFNKLESLRYDEEQQSYFGLSTEIQYTDEIVNLCEE
jgi:hypothetical protein